MAFPINIMNVNRHLTLCFLLYTLGFRFRAIWVFLILKFFIRRFLSATKREILADYALPIAVLALSFVGSYLFQDIPREFASLQCFLRVGLFKNSFVLDRDTRRAAVIFSLFSSFAKTVFECLKRFLVVQNFSTAKRNENTQFFVVLVYSLPAVFKCVK